jgi:MFS transporter, DHA2 family, multidrug resistance protein
MESLWSKKKTIVALTLSVLTLVALINVTIVSVALPYVMGSIGANSTQASWIMSGYIIAATVCMPLTGVIAKLLGRKRAILLCCIILAITSILCGQSTSLSEIMTFRIIQGIGGAFVPSLTMGYIIETFNDEERPKIISIYTLMIIAGPSLAPILGGFITQELSWRWIFYLSTPFCIICFAILAKYMKESKREPIKIDYISFFFLCMAIGSIEFFINDGNNNNWFGSRVVTISLIIGIIFLVFFIWRSMLGKSIIDFRIFKYKNFLLACILLVSYMCIVYSVVCYFPLFLEKSYNFPVETAGLAVAPRGLVGILLTPFLAKLCKKFNCKHLLIVSILCFCLSGYFLSRLSPGASIIYLLPPILLQGVAFALFFMPMMLLAYHKFPKELSDQAGGVYNFFQMLGSSFGAALGAILITHMNQLNWNSIAGYISPYNINYKIWMQNCSAEIASHTRTILASSIVENCSHFLTYIDLFYFVMIACAIVAIIPLFLNKIDKHTV